MKVIRSLVFCVLSASPLLAQGTITDGDVSFVRGATGFDTTPEVSFTGVSSNASTDHMFEHGWWYRILTDTEEVAFGSPSTQSYVLGNQSTIIWTSLAGGLFAAEETAIVHDAGVPGAPGDGGRVEIYLRVTNLSRELPLQLQIFHMADIDVNGAVNGQTNDSAALVSYLPDRVMRLSDSGGTVGHYLADDFASKFLVRPFDATSVRNELNDAGIDNFANTGLPFGPGDITVGWQVSLSIPPEDSGYAGFRISINAPAPLQCSSIDGIFCDGFEPGSTAAWPSATP